MNIPSPPPYTRRLWEYKKANIGLIRSSLASIPWQNIFNNMSPDQMTETFNSKVLDIMTSLIPNKLVTIRDSDAPWVTPEVKTALRKNKRVFKKWVARGKSLEGRPLVIEVQSETNNIISSAKSAYTQNLGDKICDPTTGPKCFWTAFNKLINNKKITNIPPLIESNNYISNFKEKAKIFNDFFAAQCRPLNIESALPPFSPKTLNQLSSLTFGVNTIVDIIKKLDSKKAHGYDGISIAMLKLCANEIAHPLFLIFKRCIDTGTFPSQWKKANVQPVHKKIAAN